MPSGHEMQMPKIERQTISFPNGNKSSAVTASLDATAQSIVEALGLEQPKALILLSGGAAGLDESVKPKIHRLLDHTVAQVAAETHALILDGGTQSGVMELMGKAVGECEHKITLLGIAPAGKVTYPGDIEKKTENIEQLDANHTHFVLVDCDDWGCESKTLFEVAKYLGKNVPVVTILINGGALAKEEVRQSVRQKWPVLVVEKTGRLADEVAKAWKKRGKGEIRDASLNEIVEDGNIQFFNLNDRADGFEEALSRCLRKPGDETLRLAWERFSTYDLNASQRQRSFNRLQTTILLLGIVTSALALTITQFKTQLGLIPYFSQGFYYIIIFLPIATSILIAGANRFRAGNKWVLLRSSAESIKHEIFCYRTKTEEYKVQTGKTPENQLQTKVEAAGRRLMHTEVNLCALQPYCGCIPPRMYGAAARDDGYSDLSPEQYLKIRLGDQLNYYQKKTVVLEQKLKRMQWSIYGLGGIGTFLAAVGLELWIALTTTIVGVVTLYLEYQQVENTLTKYNQAATDLANLKSWWIALSKQEKEDPKNYDQLVELTESVLGLEMAGWGQRMENALSKLQTTQAEQIQQEQLKETS
jgi:hypothetical protein